MKNIAAALLAVILLIVVSAPGVLAPDPECILWDHLGCYDGNAYWYDSCGSPHAVEQYCSQNEECVDGYCESKCGNGACDSGENCGTCWSDCRCSSGQICEWNECKTYCGNGVCDGDENCATCYDCSCPSTEKCEGGRCVTFCGNGICEAGEDCKTCGRDCNCMPMQDCYPSHSKADRQGCVDRCGNGVVDYGEDCSTCAIDAKCTQGLYCFNGQCVDCLQNSHCESQKVYSGKFVCSPDHTSTIEMGMMTQGICTNHQCSGEKAEITRPGTNCGDRFCQDDHCGCNEGYEACVFSGQCEKIGELEDGATAACYFQCKSGYMSKSRVCMKAINAPLGIVKDIIYTGEQTKATISADNALDVDVQTKITLNLDSGASMSGVIGGDDCSGNQCTGIAVIPSKGRMAIEISITGESPGVKTLSATLTATIDDSEYARSETITFKIIKPEDGICSEGETQQNSCTDCGCPPATRFSEFVCGEDQKCSQKLKWWVYLTIGGAIFGGLVIIGILFLSIPYYRRVSAQRESESKKSEGKRERIAEALYRLSGQINPENPWPVSKVLKKLGFRASPDIVHEEYNEMLERMRETGSVSKKVHREKETKVEKMIEKVEEEGAEPAKFVKRAWVAALLSLLLPGLGFVYVRAYGWFVLYLAVFFALSIKTSPAGIIPWAIAVIHSYRYVSTGKYLKNYQQADEGKAHKEKGGRPLDEEKEPIKKASQKEEASPERKITAGSILSFAMFILVVIISINMMANGSKVNGLVLLLIAFIWWPLKWLVKLLFNAKLSFGARVALTGIVIALIITSFSYSKAATPKMHTIPQAYGTTPQVQEVIDNVRLSLHEGNIVQGLLVSDPVSQDILSAAGKGMASADLSLKDISFNGPAITVLVHVSLFLKDGSRIDREARWVLEKQERGIMLVDVVPSFSQIMGESGILSTGSESRRQGIVAVEESPVKEAEIYKFA
ncbi:MAG: hypothetical protein ABIB71_00730 [Candidatus Woesearchaeota archaeon]